MTRIRLNKAHYPVTTLGPGTRAGFWTQGCTLACPGCVSRDTWPADPDTEVDVDALIGWLASLPEPLDGVTISGGEPMQQPEALRALLDGIDEWRGRRAIDILVYTGYGRRWVAGHPDLVRHCDAVITGRYVERLNTGARWRGSTNQQIVPLTALGRRRYESPANDPDAETALQVSVTADGIWYIGIPRRDDMERLATRLEAVGIHHTEVSWRP